MTQDTKDPDPCDTAAQTLSMITNTRPTVEALNTLTDEIARLRAERGEPVAWEWKCETAPHLHRGLVYDLVLAHVTCPECIYTEDYEGERSKVMWRPLAPTGEEA